MEEKIDNTIDNDDLFGMSNEELEARRGEVERKENQEGPVFQYADGLDIIAQYRSRIFEVGKEVAKLEKDLRSKENDIRIAVEEEWREKKTSTLSNEKLRQIETEKRVGKDQECIELDEAIETLKSITAYDTIYKENEERAFKQLLLNLRLSLNQNE